MANKPFCRPRSKSDLTAESNSYRKKYEELVEFKVGWKQKYEQMEMQYEALNDEKASLEGENIALKTSVSQLEEQLILLEHERKGIAKALNTEQYRNGKFLFFIIPCTDPCAVRPSACIYCQGACLYKRPG